MEQCLRNLSFGASIGFPKLIMENQGKSLQTVALGGNQLAKVHLKEHRFTPGFVQKYHNSSYSQPLSITITHWFHPKQCVFMVHHLYLLAVSKAAPIISTEALRGTNPAGHLPFAKGCQTGTGPVFGKVMAPSVDQKWDVAVRLQQFSWSNYVRIESPSYKEMRKLGLSWYI